MGNSQTAKLRPEAISELVETTNFTEDQIRKWYKDFIKDFPEGNLSVDQFKDIYIQHFPNGDATKFAEHVFRTFDKDRDDTLDFREFMCALSITAHGDPKERLRWAFNMYDVDENGYISKKECAEIVRAFYRMLGGRLSMKDLEQTPEQRTDHLFELLDLDRNENISLEEFIQGIHTDPAILGMIEQDMSKVFSKK